MNFINTVQKMVAVTALGPSTLRNQGKGILKKAQEYLSNLDLSRYFCVDQAGFNGLLDKNTEELLDYFGLKNRPWGAARKAANLFLRDALYNKYLSDEYNLETIEPFLEVPLDSVVANALRKRTKENCLPQWPGLKSLKKEISDQYQVFAEQEAKREKISRVHLDIFLWLENR